MTELLTQENEYRLVFEGPSDSTPDTMRKIKGVFLAELEMPVDEILSILQNAPATVRSASTPDELHKPLKLLQDAGSKVMIVGKNGQPWIPETIEGLDGAILFELDDSNDEPEAEQENPSTKAFSLEDNAPGDLTLLLEEAASGIEDTLEEEEESSLSETSNAYVLPIDKELSLSLDEKDKESAPTVAIEETIEDAPLLVASEEPVKNTETENAHSPAKEEFNLTLALEDDIPHTIQAVPSATPAEQPEPTSEFEEKLGLSLEGEDPPEPVIAKKVEAPAPPTPSFEDSIAPDPIEPPPVEAKTLPAAPAAKPTAAAPKAPAKMSTPPPSADSVPPDINVVPVRDRRKKKLPPGVDIGVAIAFGTMLLIVANWMYFNAPPPVDDAEMIQAQEMALKVAQKKKDLMKRQRAEAERLEKEAAALAKPYVYTVATDIETTHFELTLTVANGAPQTAILVIRGTEPPERTNEQIARNESRPAWIRRAETAPFEFTQNEDGTFSAQATSKIFVESDVAPYRLIRQTTISGRVPTQSDTTATLSVTISQKESRELANDSWTLASGQQEVEFSMKKTFELNLQSVELPAGEAELKKEEERTVK